MLLPLRAADPVRCGAKAATLGRLLAAGLPVPDGVVLPFDHDARSLDHHARDAWNALAPGPVAVRSSADGEDSPDASMAGQHATVLGARTATEVATAVRTCLASPTSDGATAYRQRLGVGEPRMAVIVQRLVHADAAGVMFTTGSHTVIEAAPGLGTAVVGGHVTPDRYQVTADGTVDHRPGDGDGATRVLDDGAVAELVALGRAVAAVLGSGQNVGGQDIEWAISDGVIWILQARPITAPLPEAAPSTRAATPTASTLHGSPGSSGVAAGPARVVRGPADFARVRPGDILVCPYTDPAWTPLLAVAAGVVTRTGGVLSHAAIVAREFAIPAVLGVPGALDRIDDGALVTVDGDAGTVTLGAGT